MLSSKDPRFQIMQGPHQDNKRQHSSAGLDRHSDKFKLQKKINTLLASVEA